MMKKKKEQNPAVTNPEAAVSESTKAPKKKSSFWKKLKITLIVLVVLAVLAAGGLGYAGYKVTTSPVNYPNLYMGEVAVGGLTKAETVAALDASGWNALLDETIVFTLPCGVSETIAYETAGYIPPIDEAADMAYAFGHSGNWFKNLRLYVECLFNGTDIAKTSADINDSYLYSNIDSAIKSFEKQMADDSCTISDKTGLMTVMKGAKQTKLDRDELYNLLREAMDRNETRFDYQPSDASMKAPDFEAIHAELAVEPQNAYFDAENKEIIESKDGFDFDVEEALRIWKNTPVGTVAEIPVQVLEPEISTAKLKEVIFADVLGSMTTSFAGSNANRINNIAMACSRINGVILNPGEVFSYNGTVGQRTEEAGFLPAGAYADGEVVEEVGGGICQVSSTLYAATLYSRLETVSRTCHYFPVAYMDKGIDATVSWPNPDFKFRNNTEFPIKIVVWFDEIETRSLTIEIMGTATDDYTVKLWHETNTYSGPFEYDGVTYNDVAQATVTLTYRSVYDSDGNLLYSEIVNRNSGGDMYYDYYYYHKEDILRKLGIDPNKPTSESSTGSSEGGTLSLG